MLFLEQLLQQTGLMEKPSQIYNCDETGISSQVSGRIRAYGKKGERLCQKKVRSKSMRPLWNSLDSYYKPRKTQNKCDSFYLTDNKPWTCYLVDMCGCWWESASTFSDICQVMAHTYIRWCITPCMGNCSLTKWYVIGISNYLST